MVVEVLALLPGILLLALANYSEKRKELRILTQVFLGMIIALVILTGLTVAGVGNAGVVEGIRSAEAYGYGLVITGLISFLLFLRPIRVLLSKVTGIEPGNWLHATALVFAALLVGISATTAATADVVTVGRGSSSALTVVLQDAFFVIASLVGVGWLVRKRLGEALKRLGLVRPSLRDIGFAIIYLMILFALVIVVGAVTKLLDMDSGILDNENDPTIEILGGVSIATAVIFALGAGIGEETLFRGAMQPKFGIVLTSLIFTVLHIQYPNPIQMGTLFAVGIVFGYERKVINTSTAIITHTLYDMLLLLSVALT